MGRKKSGKKSRGSSQQAKGSSKKAASGQNRSKAGRKDDILARQSRMDEALATEARARDNLAQEISLAEEAAINKVPDLETAAEEIILLKDVLPEYGSENFALDNHEIQAEGRQDGQAEKKLVEEALATPPPREVVDFANTREENKARKAALSTAESTSSSGKKSAGKHSGAGARSDLSGREQKRGGGIGPAVFLPCLFLALVLGVYLGTLLPGMYAEFGRKLASQPRLAPQPAPQANLPMPAPPRAQANSIENRIANLVSRTILVPGDVQAWIELGNSYFDADQPRKAIEAYTRALEIDPHNADVLTDMGIMYRNTGDYQKAVESFRKASATNPRHVNAMFNEGVVLFNDLKRPQEARKAWERLLSVNPEARSPDGKRVADMVGQLR